MGGLLFGVETLQQRKPSAGRAWTNRLGLDQSSERLTSLISLALAGARA
jgi:hypothetical protein